MSDQEDLLAARRLTLLNHGERISGMGSWEWAPELHELLWSDNLFRLFGLEPGAMDPVAGFVLERTHPDDRPQVEEALQALLAGEWGERELHMRIFAADGTVRTLQLTVATLEQGDGVPRRIVGAVQDVTSQRHLDRELAAHVAVTRSLDDWTSAEHGAVGLLQRLGDAMELAFGAFWVPDGTALVAQAIWHRPSPALESVAQRTLQWSPGVGDATLGRALAGKQPVISSRPSEGGSTDRHLAIEHAALRGGLAIPAVWVDETLAVLEFLSHEPIEDSERLARTLDGIGHEIGRFLSHRAGDLCGPVLTPRGVEVLQLAAQGETATAIAARLALSPATVKRHFERTYTALEVSDRAAAVAVAMRRGLIT